MFIFESNFGILSTHKLEARVFAFPSSTTKTTTPAREIKFQVKVIKYVIKLLFILFTGIDTRRAGGGGSFMETEKLILRIGKFICYFLRAAALAQ